ncbi:MAG: mucin-binding protein [Lactobacillus helveticus]
MDQGHTYSVDKFNEKGLYNVDGTIKPKTYVVKVLRGVKEITPAATATRKVYYKANNKDGETLKDSVTQELTLKASKGTYYVDATLKADDPNAKKLVHIKQATDINGTKINVVDSENTTPIDTSWVIDHTKNLHDVDDQFNFDKPAGEEAPETIGEWHHIPADDINDGADVNVYYFHDQEDVTTDKPGFDIDVKELKKTFIRTIIYRGTRDEGKTYQDVNGSPDSTHVYKQSVTFTRKAIIDSVTKKVVRYTDWTSDKPEMDEAPSKKPSEVGYDKVDKAKVAGISVNPDSDKTDLGLIVVTYTAVVPDGGGSTGGDNGGKEQQPPKDEDKTPNLDKKPEKKPGKSEETKNPEEHKVPGKQKEEKKPEETKKTSKKSDKSETKVASEKSTKKSIKAIKKTVDKSPNSALHSEDWNKNHAPHNEWNENHAARGEWQSNHGQWQANNMPKSEEMSNSSSVTEDKTNTLPQTGEKDSNNSVMGLIALSFASLLSIFGLNRKKKN